MKTYALVPAYNEAKTIGTVVSRLKKLGIQTIVIDDNSKDGTAEIAKKKGAIVIQNKGSKGKGEAMRTGFQELKKKDFDYLVAVDADLQYDPSEAGRLLEPLKKNEADFVMGYRQPKKVPYANRMGNFGWRMLFNLLFGTRMKDTNCGFIAMTKKAMKKVSNIYGGYIIENSILINAINNNLRIVQVPVTVKYGNRRVPKFARMFFGVMYFIVKEGFKHRLGLNKD